METNRRLYLNETMYHGLSVPFRAGVYAFVRVCEVEDTRRPKCNNQLLSVITFGLKCNNVIPTSSVTLLTCCWLLVVISCVISHIIKKVSEHVFSGLSRE